MAEMTAVFCTGKEKIEVRAAPRPAPGPGEVLVRVRVCGICGSDLHFYNGALPAMPTVSLGHEFAGEVAEVGEGVAGFEPGQRVVVEPLKTCRECVYCRTGQHQLCSRRVLLGSFQPGGMAEYIAVPPYTLYPLPEGLDFPLGALVEPTAVAVHGLHLVDLVAGEKVLVMGSGMIGLASVLVARAFGASDVVATYRHEHQGRAALSVGAARVVKDGETGGLEKEGFDVVVETVGGAAPTLSQALGIVRQGGRVSLLGLFTQPAQVNALGMTLKETRIVGAITYCRPGPHSDFDTAIAILERQADAARSLITHTFPLEDAPKAFATAADKSSGSVKVHLKTG
jgi:L-iditol 2-dehydrogenase